MGSGSALERAAALVAAAQRTCVLTGAGISTDSGIPDFRGPNGLWTRDPTAQRYVNFDAYRADPTLRIESWQRRAAHPAFAATPNAAHRALVELNHAGRLPVTLTQNIDRLHQRAGLPAASVIELHGTVHETECIECGDRRPMPEVLARVRAGELDPACESCGGVLKSATIFFGQPLDPRTFDAAIAAIAASDLVLAVGTSLTVHPVAGLIPMAHRAAIPIVIINAEPTPCDQLAELVVRDPIGVAVPAIVALGVSAGIGGAAS